MVWPLVEQSVLLTGQWGEDALLPYLHDFMTFVQKKHHIVCVREGRDDMLDWQ